MSITLKISCDGCHVEAEIENIRVNSRPIYGNYIQRTVPTIQECMPEGWIAFDPYTAVTYCKECWNEIEKK